MTTTEKKGKNRDKRVMTSKERKKRKKRNKSLLFNVNQEDIYIKKRGNRTRRYKGEGGGGEGKRGGGEGGGGRKRQSGKYRIEWNL